MDDLDRVREAMAWAQRDLAAEAQRLALRHPRRTKAAIAYALAGDPTAIAALPGSSRTERSLLLHELASRRQGEHLSPYLLRLLPRTTGVSSGAVPGLASFFGRVRSGVVRSVLRAPDEELVAARDLLVQEPALIAGWEQRRSGRKRAAMRLVMFTALLHQLRVFKRQVV